MSDQATALVCAECGCEIAPDRFDPAYDSEDPRQRPYHWSCLQEFYERMRLADGGDA